MVGERATLNKFVMPQLQLPIFPAGVVEINRHLAAQCKDGMVVYIHGHLPTYHHQPENLKAFRYYTSQLIDTGAAKAPEIARAFGVPLATVKRYVKVYREQREAGFFQPRSRQRSETKLTDEIKQQAQELLEAGGNVAEVGRSLNILPTTLHKAIRSERLVVKKKR